MSARELKGIIPITLNDEQVYKVEFTFNSLVVLEELYGTIEEVFVQLQNPNLGNIRGLLYAGLHEHYELTLKETGRLIDFNNFNEIVRVINEAVVFAFPTEKKTKK